MNVVLLVNVVVSWRTTLLYVSTIHTEIVVTDAHATTRSKTQRAAAAAAAAAALLTLGDVRIGMFCQTIPQVSCRRQLTRNAFSQSQGVSSLLCEISLCK